ncbi:4a-hydroxytetrahydrobiopterin dehydratase [Schnuerera sp. xch1]|uniref:4a-hydroxytetrahydrobiopterin dehydratase n=1 Tax=Schnuerera sp. xch1 TaxID=2874283 RepID=UPI001CBF79A6|nr:4a-hydroxytetrahydrobiopterin dehydratase [Schnuerera sp. xch1]MBZ2176009.1 4a-hydroxytetrahydrobiopterin dehydratase [Schnuerera sp. xch1]
MANLTNKRCIPCSIGAPTLVEEEIKELYKSLKDGWKVIDNKQLEKTYKFKNFKEALDFTNKVGILAEKEGHHPDIYLSWGKVIIKLWTHKIGGLHENDFILAAKIDEINQNSS